MFSCVIPIFKSLPVIWKDPSSNLICPSSSPILNSPDEDINTPLPPLIFGVGPNFNSPAEESTSKLSVSSLNVAAPIVTPDPETDNSFVDPLKLNLFCRLKLLDESK